VVHVTFKIATLLLDIAVEESPSVLIKVCEVSPHGFFFVPHYFFEYLGLECVPLLKLLIFSHNWFEVLDCLILLFLCSGLLLLRLLLLCGYCLNRVGELRDVRWVRYFIFILLHLEFIKIWGIVQVVLHHFELQLIRPLEEATLVNV